MSQFTDNGTCRERIIGAQLGSPQRTASDAGEMPSRAGLRVRENGRSPSEPEFEPVHGWSLRQRDDYLARNPAYRPVYSAMLNEHVRPPLAG